MADNKRKGGKKFKLNLGLEKPKSYHSSGGSRHSNGNGGRNWNGNYGNRNNRPQAPAISFATAPYNFVSLIPVLIPSEVDAGHKDWLKMKDDEKEELYRQFIEEKGTLSGYIELDMVTKTPFFIGGNGEDFFAPAGRPIIPGSSIRGMTRNIFKILTCGSMRKDEDFHDEQLYFRRIMRGKGKSGQQLSSYYARKLGCRGDRYTKADNDTEAGFLVQIGDNYFIYPVHLSDSDKFYRIEDYEEKFKVRIHDSSVKWNLNQTTGRGDVYILTGRDFPKKTYVRHIPYPVWKNPIPVPKDVVDGYKNDKRRVGTNNAANGLGVNLFSDKDENGKTISHNILTGEAARKYTGMKDAVSVVPCFYTMERGKVATIGHGRYYRIPYEHSIGDHIPEELERQTVDMADALFGRKELWAGRLYFDDGELQGEPDFLDQDYSRPLSSPKPTSYQLYLKQDKAAETNPNDLVKHWDDDADIRGYKMYWHQKIGDQDWKPRKGVKIFDGSHPEQKQEGQDKIHPLRAGAHFTARIRFSHLTPVELGALYSVFNLQAGAQDHEIAYKLGQGKTIGMGSVKIRPSLFLEDSSQRYTELFDENGWQEAISGKDASSCVSAFETYRLSFLGNQKIAFTNMEEELRTLMDWKNTNQKDWNSKTENMLLKGFTSKVPLKSAIDFVKDAYKK